MATIDLHELGADDTLRLWQQVQRVLANRTVDRELRMDLERLLPLMDPETADEIRRALDEVHPVVVLREWWDAFYGARFPDGDAPARRAPRVDRPPTAAPDPTKELSQMYEADPSRLANAVRQIARFTDDVDQIIEAAVAHARSCQVPETVFEPIITAAVRDVRNGSVGHVG